MHVQLLLLSCPVILNEKSRIYLFFVPLPRTVSSTDVIGAFCVIAKDHASMLLMAMSKAGLQDSSCCSVTFVSCTFAVWHSS